MVEELKDPLTLPLAYLLLNELAKVTVVQCSFGKYPLQ